MLAIVGLGYPLAVLPLFREYKNNGRFDVASRIAKRDALAKNVGELEAARVAFSKLSKEFEEKLRRALPEDDDTAGIMVTLDTLAGAAAMQLVSIDVAPRKEPVPGVGGVFPVEIGITLGGGDYSRLKAFLASVEHSLRIMDVTAIAFSPRTSSYALSLRAYSRMSR